MFELRAYQQEAVEAIYRSLRERDDNPCVVIPTGGGKTPVMAQVCKDAVGRWNGRVMILAHVKELLEQNREKLHLVAPEMWKKTGVYSAGLKSRDTEQPIIVAGIQSVYKRACEFDPFDLIIIDEAHMIPPDGDGMYRTFLEDARKVNPNVRLIGLTATPYRMKRGMICERENVLNHVCYEIGVRELIVQGYLCPLVTKASREKVDTSMLHVRAGEFVADEVEDLMNTDDRVESACREIVEQTRNRKSVLIFAAGVEHGRHVADVLLGKFGAQASTVFGDTLDFERDRVLSKFKRGELQYLVNVNVLTTGFDAPNIDCVAMVRPTLSPGLYYQMVGRGFRLNPGKENCLVLDFGGNVMRHGPVDAVRVRKVCRDGDGDAPAKECPECQSLIAAGYSVCPDCGYEFPDKNQRKHEVTASTEGILSGQVTTEELPVYEVRYFVHRKKGAPEDAPKTMRVDYRVGYYQCQSEWICFEHKGWARKTAEAWWRKRSNALVPETAVEAVGLGNAGALCETESITVRSIAGEEYPRIIGYELGEKPPWREPGWDEEELDEVRRDYAQANVAAAGNEDIPF
ncbi:MAG: DEAD/DEAH box helicase family protein [Deltaproteobacteria bacterium]|nr:DEAD/DEAH box helicase family protein [Deltaproteobacteria bacterium]